MDQRAIRDQNVSPTRTSMTRSAASSVNHTFHRLDRHSGSSGCAGVGLKASRRYCESGIRERASPAGTAGRELSSSALLACSGSSASSSTVPFSTSSAVVAIVACVEGGERAVSSRNTTPAQCERTSARNGCRRRRVSSRSGQFQHRHADSNTHAHRPTPALPPTALAVAGLLLAH